MTRHRCVFLCLLAAASAVPVQVSAQTPAPPPRHEGTGEFAFVGVTGNASSRTIGLSFETIARPSTWVFRHRFAYLRNESEDVLLAHAISYAGRAEKTLRPRAGVFGEYGFFRDRFAGVTARHSASTGINLQLLTGDTHRLSADAGVGYLEEHRLTGGDVSTAIYTTGAKYVWKLSETAQLADEVAVVGSFDRGADWRLTHTVSVTAALTGALSLKASNSVRRANMPPPGFQATDTITSIALVVKFTRP